MVPPDDEVEAGGRVLPLDPALCLERVRSSIDEISEADDTVVVSHLELSERPA